CTRGIDNYHFSNTDFDFW
nr:immunoglobulin heavy chain junction region [Macaca mulatta]MOX60783.1 immunoglobulin heavy chain junction region [Macaca mulatta]MOX61327.1 immunoglobulin heavy chain junction region [Macaca mulatta]MOX61922.1 immunoglobulin heavy chain junction region [Macaca mulatta]MOX68956.1 immunoglobulin heavy chain junction region [Macaca mulatta]